MVRANSVCFSLRLPCWLSASSFDRISSELSGVRSSWLILARNSDLYFEVSASCSAFSSIARRAMSISKFLASTWRFSFSSSCAFSCSSSLVACSSSCLVVSSVWRACSSCVSSCDSLSSSSVRIVAAMVLSTMPTVSISCVEEAVVGLVELLEAGQLDDRLDLVLEQRRQDVDVGRAAARQGRSRCGYSRPAHCRAASAACRRRPGRSALRASAKLRFISSRLPGAIAGDEVEAGVVLVVLRWRRRTRHIARSPAARART